MNTWLYVITPFATWLVTGVIKFLVNCILERRMAFDLIGYGGMPSNHSSIVSSMVTLVALREGADSAAFGVALTFSYIVVLDASSLRRVVGKHAQAINQLSSNALRLRERIGHSKLEILAGLLVGASVAFLLNRWL